MIKNALNLGIGLERINILTILGLPIYEHGVLLHLFRSSFIFFQQCNLVTLSLKFFYIFYVFVNAVIF